MAETKPWTHRGPLHSPRRREHPCRILPRHSAGAHGRWESCKLSPPPGKVKIRHYTHLPHVGSPSQATWSSQMLIYNPPPPRTKHRLVRTSPGCLLLTGGMEAVEKPRPEAAEGCERTVLYFCTLSKPVPAASFLPPAQSCHPQGVKCVVKPKFKGSSKKISAPSQELTCTAEGPHCRDTPPQITGQYFLEFCVILGTALTGSQCTPAALLVPNHTQPPPAPAVPNPTRSSTPTFGTCGIYICTSAAAGSSDPKQPQIQLTD